MDLNPTGWPSEQVWDVLDKFGILVGDIFLLATLAGAALGFVQRRELRSWLLRGLNMGRPTPVRFDVVERQQWDAIAFTISHAEVPIRVLDRHLDTERVGLIYSELSRPAAEKIKNYLRERGKPPPEEQVIQNADDPAEAQRKTRYLLEGWQAEDLSQLAVDVTGGKTPMSLGAFLAARDSGASTLYVTSDYGNLRKPDLDTAVVRCISKPE